MAISRPTILRRSRDDSASKSISPKRMRSAVMCQLSLATPAMALATKLFPEPDSPTKPRISLSLIVILIRSTAFTRPCGVSISIVKLRISSNGISLSPHSELGEDHHRQG